MNRRHRVLVVGLGGLGAPVIRLLARSPIERLTVVDDDRVEESNLHRQTLYSDEDVGNLKVDCVVAWLSRAAPDLEVDAIQARFTPSSAESMLEGHTLVVEGADNLPTKFLVADAARLFGVPAIQAGAVRWSGWALGSTAESACLRCLFEDLPRDRVETCAEAGVIGPVVGALGAVQGAMALRTLRGEELGGELWHLHALRGGLRRTSVRRRRDCPLCSHEIRDLRTERYTAACAA